MGVSGTVWRMGHRRIFAYMWGGVCVCVCVCVCVDSVCVVLVPIAMVGED